MKRFFRVAIAGTCAACVAPTFDFTEKWETPQNGIVVSEHELATRAGVEILEQGGNAADAACAMGFALQVLEPTQNGPGGEVPILVYDAAEDRSVAISGQGPAPAAARAEQERAGPEL